MEHFFEPIHGFFNFNGLYDEMVEKYPSGSKFVEVGCWLGRSAAYLGVQIVNSGKDIKLDCVDTWLGSIELANEDVVKDRTLYKKFINNIEPLRKIIKPIRCTSAEAATFYEDESIDFCYLDDDHTRKGFGDSINGWFPKVKKGGVIAGHDYDYGDISDTLQIFFPNKDFEVRPCSSWVYYKK